MSQNEPYNDPKIKGASLWNLLPGLNILDFRNFSTSIYYVKIVLKGNLDVLITSTTVILFIIVLLCSILSDVATFTFFVTWRS